MNLPKREMGQCFTSSRSTRERGVRPTSSMSTTNETDPQQQSRNIRISTGRSGESIQMVGISDAAESADEVMHRKMMDIWEKSDSEYYRMKMAEEWKMRRILKLRMLRESETNPIARNVLEEKYVQECRSFAYPSLVAEDRPDGVIL